jgi:hypothetical protein
MSRKYFSSPLFLVIGTGTYDVLNSRSILNILDELFSTMKGYSILTVWLGLIHIQL